MMPANEHMNRPGKTAARLVGQPTRGGKGCATTTRRGAPLRTRAARRKWLTTSEVAHRWRRTYGTHRAHSATTFVSVAKACC